MYGNKPPKRDSTAIQWGNAMHLMMLLWSFPRITSTLICNILYESGMSHDPGLHPRERSGCTVFPVDMNASCTLSAACSLVAYIEAAYDATGSCEHGIINMSRCVKG
eukprot:2873551-Pleurochrysis_carterae.AAC.2